MKSPKIMKADYQPVDPTLHQENISRAFTILFNEVLKERVTKYSNIRPFVLKDDIITATMVDKQIPQRYAFIDVQNTASTTRKLLGFLIDWHKLCTYLKDKWKCEKVFFYSGIDEGDTETAKEFEALLSNGCIVKTKTVYSYKRPDRTIAIKCVQCGADNAEVIDMGYNRKSNCDVDLTVDAIEEAGPGKEFLIFTGDGDFDYLIRKVIAKGTKVFVVSSNAGIKKPGLNTKRLSTKLKEVIKENPKNVHLIEIDSWKMKIQKSL